jgi:catechol 2,3-dioxygenase-like lactoylglutathione lyase family enzyme
VLRSLLVALLLAPALARAQARATARLDVQAVGPVGLTVSDLDRAVAFFTRVLGFTVVSDTEVVGESYERLEGLFGVRMRIARLVLGGEELELTEYLAPRGRPYPAGSRSNDRWFQHVAIIVSDMDSAYRVLRANKVEHISTGPQTIPVSNPAAGGIRAFYFRDPDGHPLEILWFPVGKGADRWHETDRLFLGIDHTAIAVGGSDRSLRFYRDLLGLRVTGHSHNYGTEQAHLGNVEGAELHITGLRAPEGPGIEFLEYAHPRTGRPAPEDERANDLVQVQTTLVVSDAAAAAWALARWGAPPLSAGPVDAPGLGFRRAFLVRDPDGHVLRVVER